MSVEDDAYVDQCVEGDNRRDGTLNLNIPYEPHRDSEDAILHFVIEKDSWCGIVFQPLDYSIGKRFRYRCRSLPTNIFDKAQHWRIYFQNVGTTSYDKKAGFRKLMEINRAA